MNVTEGKVLVKANADDSKEYQELPDPLDALLSKGLLPSGTARQALAPTDTSVFWLDISSNPYVLKNHNGTAWVAATFSDVYVGEFFFEEFYADATFTVPQSIIGYLDITIIGGGGGGSGGTSSSSYHADTHIGGGGGGGGGVINISAKIAAGQSIPITVGAGGSGGLYNATGSSSGNNGGISSFGTLATAFGGIGATNSIGGIGATGTISLSAAKGLAQRGGNGGNAFDRGYTDRWYGANGGFSPYGGGGGASRISSAHFSGRDSNTVGSGGGGASISPTIDSTVKGGDGSSGAVIVRYFK